MNSVRAFVVFTLSVLPMTAAVAAVSHSDRAVFSFPHSHRMFEDFVSNVQISADGKWILRTAVDGRQDLHVLQTGVLAGSPQPVHLERIAADVDTPQHRDIDGHI